jgi:hypothetical protein
MRERAWLIEAAGPKWWDGSGSTVSAFTADHFLAIRFGRQQDAEKVISWILSPIQSILKATEHIWGLDITEPAKSKQTDIEREWIRKYGQAGWPKPEPADVPSMCDVTECDYHRSNHDHAAFHRAIDSLNRDYVDLQNQHKLDVLCIDHVKRQNSELRLKLEKERDKRGGYLDGC